MVLEGTVVDEMEEFIMVDCDEDDDDDDEEKEE